MLVPVCFVLWSYVQPWYGSLIAGATNQLLAWEESGERVTRLVEDEGAIRVWSTLRDDGEPAGGYQGDLLHFYLVLCVSLVLALPEPRGWRRLRVLGISLLGLMVFHAVALLITVEHTYAVSLAKVAERNYSPAEARAYAWLQETFVYFAVQLIPATLMLALVVLYGGLGRRLRAGRKREDEDRAAAPDGPRPERRRLPILAVATTALLAVIVTGLYLHRDKVRARQAEAATFRGYRQLDSAGPEPAAMSFMKAVRLNPDLAAAQRGLGQARLKLGLNVEAEQAFRASARLEPGNFETDMGIANALLNQDRMEDAVEHYREAAERHPRRWEPRYNLGRALYRIGDLNGAADAFQETIDLYPGFAPARLEMAKVIHKRDGICPALPHLESFVSLAAGTEDALKVESLIRQGREICGAGGFG